MNISGVHGFVSFTVILTFVILVLFFTIRNEPFYWTNLLGVIVSKPQNHKLTILAVCGLGFSCLTGFLFATQKHSMNISGVHGFVSFTVKGDL